MKPVIDPRLCKGCNICVYICPKKCYNHNREGKLVCELCIMSCPDQAISWHEETEEEKKK